MAKKFLRRITNRLSKLGKRRKKKQIWRKPTGRDNKMREKRRGYPVVVSVGFKKAKKERKTSIIINNLKDLEKVKKDDVALIGNIGKKKKLDIAKKAKEKGLEIANLNVKKFLKKNEKPKKPEEKTSKSTQSSAREEKK